MISKYRLAILLTIPILLILAKFYSWIIFGAAITLTDHASRISAFLAPSLRDFEMLMQSLFYGFSWAPVLVSISFIIYVIISYVIALVIAMCLIWIFATQRPNQDEG